MRISKTIILVLFFLAMLNPRSIAYGAIDANASLNSYEWRMQRMVDGVLSFIQEGRLSPEEMILKAPQQQCLRGVKRGLYSAGLLKRYPAWRFARAMDKILKSKKQTKRFVKEEYHFVHLKNVKKVKDAPAYSLLIYEGAPYGHIELKVPADYLSRKGLTHALSSLGTQKALVSLDKVNFVYVSDYIDAFPRNHRLSRVANNRVDNQRPLKAVFQLQKRKIYGSAHSLI